MTNLKLLKPAAILAILVLSVMILVYAKSFLIPLTFAAILAMLLLPVTKWLESKGVNKALATLASILLLAAFFTGIIIFFSSQVSELAGNTSKLEQQVVKTYDKAKETIAEYLGIPRQKQEQMIAEQQKSSQGKLGTMISGFLSGLAGFVTNVILVLVYIFLFIYFRGRLKGFILRLVPKTEVSKASETVESAQKVSQKYLTGLFMMIICLWIMYGIGFTIAGVKNPLFFAVICGLLEIVPFVGNLTGTALTLMMSLVQGGGTDLVIGILVTYGLVQFLQTYILEPLVVGAEVNINPLFTIVGLVAGELLWGIPGMILAIPLMGIAKIVCDHVDALKPYGYLIGQDKKESGLQQKRAELADTIRGWFGKSDKKPRKKTANQG